MVTMTVGKVKRWMLRLIFAFCLVPDHWSQCQPANLAEPESESHNFPRFVKPGDSLEQLRLVYLNVTGSKQRLSVERI
jgi:hypothetical protein